MKHMKKWKYMAPMAMLPMASQAAIDTTEITASFADTEAALIVVGGLIIGLAAVAFGYKWIKGMIFG